MIQTKQIGSNQGKTNKLELRIIEGKMKIEIEKGEQEVKTRNYSGKSVGGALA